MSNVDKIKDRLGIVEVISSYIKVEKGGKNFKAKCPFHQEKTPSFSISPERGLYYCFGCGVKGDIFNFVQEFEGVDFKGALKILADRAGIVLEKENPKTRDEREKLSDILEQACLFFEDKLKKNKEAKGYLGSRGFEEETVTNWRLGYAPDDWRELFEFFQKNNIDAELLIKSGLIKKKSEGRGYYDVFRDRIMFPIFDPSGRVIAFSGRQLQKSDTSPKYLNSPETILFDKSRTLYGFDRAKEAIRKKGYTILVEGQIDIVSSHQAGITNTVASSGTAVTIDHLSRLKMLSPNLIISFDSDPAGLSAARRTAELALGIGMDVKIASLPEGSDPADLLQKSVDEYKEVLKKAQFAIPFFLDVACKEAKDNRTKIKLVRSLVFPIAAHIESSMEMDRVATLIAERLDISKQSVLDDLKSIEKSEEGESVKESSYRNSPEREIMGIILWQEENENSSLEIDKLKEKIKEVVGDEYFEKLMNRANELKDELIFEMETRYGDSISEKIANDIISRIQSKSIKKRIEDVKSKILISEKENNNELLQDLLKEFDNLIKELSELSNK